MLSDTERLQRWVYDASRLWGVPAENVDESFYEECIGPCDSKNIHSTVDFVYTAKRVGDFVNHTLSENKLRFATRLEEIKFKGDDVNIELFKAQSSSYFKKLLHGQYFLEKLLPEGFDKRKLLQGEVISMSAKDMDTRIKPVLSSMSDTKYKDLLATFPDLK